jgi:hypothetical protein
MTYAGRCLLAGILLVGGLLVYAKAVQSQETEQPDYLEVIGTGVVYRDNVAKARDDAIEQGLWNAVEEAVGILISPASVLSHFQLLNDRVYSQPEQFIHEYKVLTESKSGRYYRVIVRTTLLMNILKDKLQNIGILMTDRELPTIVFLLSEQNVGETSALYSWGQDPLARLPLAVEDALSRFIRDKGFVIVNPGNVLVDDRDLEPELMAHQLADETAIRLAQQTGADVVVTGEAVARYSGNVLGTDMKSVEAKLSARALRVDNGMVVGIFDASGAAVHANEMVAGTEALTLAAANMGEDLTRQIAANWGRETRQTVLVELVVQGIREYVDFVKFRRILKNEIRGIKNVYLRGIKAGEAKMDVDLQGDTRSLADELMLKTFEGFGVNIFEVSQNTISLEFIGKSAVQDEPWTPQEPAAEPTTTRERDDLDAAQ